MAPNVPQLSSGFTVMYFKVITWPTTCIFNEFIRFVESKLSYKSEPTFPFNFHTVHNGQIYKMLPLVVYLCGCFSHKVRSCRRSLVFSLSFRANSFSSLDVSRACSHLLFMTSSNYVGSHFFV